MKSADDRVPCAHARPPPPPNVKGSGGSLDLVFADWFTEAGTLSADDAGNRRYRNIGFDLDDTCTGEGEGPSCDEPIWANADHTDGVGGIDNAFGQISNGSTVDSFYATEKQPDLLLRVREYSGEADDDQVEVSLYYSFGLSTRDDGKSGLQWDGQDRWAVLPDVLQNPTDGGTISVEDPRFVDKQAYVSGHVVVAQFDAAIVIVPPSLSPTSLWPAKILIAGTLRPPPDAGDGTWGMDGTWAARVQIATLLKAETAVLIPDVPQTQTFCQRPNTYKVTGQVGCSFVDIAYNGDSPSSTCDAVSMAYLFHAKQALLGDVASGPFPTPPPCDPSFDPQLESCDFLWNDR